MRIGKLGNTKPVIVGVVAAATVIAITGAATGTGVGAVFNLGKTNKVNATSILTGSASGSMLSVTNSGAGPALSMQVKAGKAPFSINSSTQIPKLNASLLGGLAAGQFVQGGGQSRSFGFTMTTASNKRQNLLAVPGFGTLTAVCAYAGTGFADVDFMTGAQSMDKMLALLTPTSQTLSSTTLIPNTNFRFLSVEAAATPAAWEQAILRYTTGSGASLTTHMATLNVMAVVDSTTCDFDASVVTS